MNESVDVIPRDQQIVRGSDLKVLSLDMSARDYPTSLRWDDPHDRSLIFAAGNPGDYQLDQQGVCEIIAVDWLLMPDEGEDPETGEVSQFVRLVLFDRDGKFFRTTASHARRRLKAALELYGPDEWADGVRFRITSRIGQRKRAYHDIRIVPR